MDAYTFCWNEEVRLPYFLRLLSPICRHIYIYDNGSTDKSKEIASGYSNVIWNTKAYGLNCINDEILKYVKNNCWKKHKDADLCFVGDMDEFPYHPMGLREFFEESIQNGYTILKPFGYEMISQELPVHNGNIFEEEEFKYAFIENKTNSIDKLFTFSPKYLDEINFNHGCHKASPKGNVNILNDKNYKLLHYKMINRDYYVGRNIESGKRLSNINIKKGWGNHYLNTKEEYENYFNKSYLKRVKII